MSLFRVFVDGQLFYHPQLSQLAITKAQVKEDADNIDSLALSAPFNHPYLSLVRPMASTIVCKKDDRIVFEGRALDDGSDLYNTHTWVCESCLAYLKDTIQPPYDYQGTLKGLLEYFVSEHNKNVEDKKKFTVGNVTVTDENDYVHYSSTDFSVTLDAIRSKLLKTHGGYLSVRYTENGRLLDYLADFSEYSVQTVEFGRNLLNVALSMDHAERATTLIPLGAKIKTIDEMGNEVETDERVGIAAVNDGKNYIFDDAAVKEIGWIWATEIWEDVTLPANLLRKAQTRLPELSKGIVSMELTIVDESDTGADIGDIHARQYVDCLSPPHGIDGRYLCVSKTTDYLNPANNTITIGASGVWLTSASVRQEQNISALEDELLGTTREINGSISSLAVNLHECYSEITKTSEQIGMAVREEYITRSDLAAIQADFETSITQSSTEIRMDFTQEVSELWGTVANNQMLLEEYIRFIQRLVPEEHWEQVFFQNANRIYGLGQ